MKHMKNEQLTISGLAVDVVRKKIKNLHLRVYPPHGHIRLSVPMHVGNEEIRQMIVSRLDWIKYQQTKFEQQPRPSVREYLTGESHYFQGRSYLLNVIEHSGAPKVILQQATLDLYVRKGSDTAKRQHVLRTWYRQQLQHQIPPLIAKWQPLMGVQVADWGVKQMKTRWGTCNIRDRRIWLALELAQKPAHCLEYVVIHEMVHLLERYHNDRFNAFMTKFMPNWPAIKKELNGLTTTVMEE
jgi:predicted metal-dependent hydrolase